MEYDGKGLRCIHFFSMHPEAVYHSMDYEHAVLMDRIWSTVAALLQCSSVRPGYFEWKKDHAPSEKIRERRRLVTAMHMCKRLVHEKTVTDDHIPARVWQYIAHEEEQMGVKILDPASPTSVPSQYLEYVYADRKARNSNSN